MQSSEQPQAANRRRDGDSLLDAASFDFPGVSIVVDWDFDNVQAFVVAANNLLKNGVTAPSWLQTPNNRITANSFVDDIVRILEPHASGRCGRSLITPKSLPHFLAVGVALVQLQRHPFPQDAAWDALRFVQSLATTLCLTDMHAPPQPLKLACPTDDDGEPLRRLFI